MLFAYLCLLALGIVVYVVLRKAGFPYALSCLLLVTLLFCVLATVSLGVNYNQSLIPGSQDGIAVSNSLALFIIGDDRWSHENFRLYFDGFLSASLILIALFVITLLWETIKNRKRSLSPCK